MPDHVAYMREALRLAARGYGATSPNPMVGALLVHRGKIIGRGWHRRAGKPHAEVEALADAQRRGHGATGATLYVTLEPCCTHGRTPPCTEAIVAGGIRRVVVAAGDPNPKHAGRGLEILRQAGVEVVTDILAAEAARLNAAFNHWIVHGTPFVTVKAAMSLDAKIATLHGESKWITSAQSLAFAMRLRRGADAILVGVNTVLADDPGLTVRSAGGSRLAVTGRKQPRRVILDSRARTPLTARVVSDEWKANTIIVVAAAAAARRVKALAAHVRVLVSPPRQADRSAIDLPWLLTTLGAEEVTALLVEGGGEVNASFLRGGFAQRIAFFYAPKVIGGRGARKGVSGESVTSIEEAIRLREPAWRRIGPDLLLMADVEALAPGV